MVIRRFTLSQLNDFSYKSLFFYIKIIFSYKSGFLSLRKIILFLLQGYMGFQALAITLQVRILEHMFSPSLKMNASSFLSRINQCELQRICVTFVVLFHSATTMLYSRITWITFPNGLLHKEFFGLHLKPLVFLVH